MRAALVTLWRRNRWLLLAFALALVLTVGFALRTAILWLHWHDPAMHDQPIEGWMTPRYVAMSWDVPRDVMMGALGLAEGERPPGRPESIAAIAAQRGMTTEQLIAEIDAAIAAYRAGQPGGSP